MPEPAFIYDDMTYVLCFGDVEIRMTYAQWDKVMSAFTTWVNTVGVGSECQIEEWAGRPVPGDTATVQPEPLPEPPTPVQEQSE